MTIKEFIHKIKSTYLWDNLGAMLLVVILFGLVIKFGLDLYTHHGQVVEVPNLIHKSYNDAEELLDELDLVLVVSDTGYVKSLPADYILEQSISPGEYAKPGRIVYVTINSAHSPTLAIPDIIDNSSYREARGKLKAMGFKLAKPEFIPGEKDWVYGITCRGKQLSAGDRVSVEELLVLQVGDGRRDLNDSVAYIDPVYEPDEDEGNAEEQTPQNSEEDDFEVVTGPED